MYALSCRRSVVARYDGILVIAYSHDASGLFARVTRDALRWIEKHDARRFQRVQKHLSGILYSNMEDYAAYSVLFRQCKVNFFAFCPDWGEQEPGHYEWYLTGYAASIVHEATHGYLRSLGFDYLPENREQVERICYTEQIRFISRVESEYYDYATEMVWPFDPSLWQESWNQTWWEMAVQLFKKLWQDKRTTNEPVQEDKTLSE